MVAVQRVFSGVWVCDNVRLTLARVLDRVCGGERSALEVIEGDVRERQLFHLAGERVEFGANERDAGETSVRVDRAGRVKDESVGGLDDTGVLVAELVDLTGEHCLHRRPQRRIVGVRERGVV